MNIIKGWFKLWVYTGAILWPALIIYEVFFRGPIKTTEPWQVIHIAYEGMTGIQKIAFVVSSPVQGMFLGSVLCFIVSIFIVKFIWDVLVQPTMHKMGMWEED